MFKKYLQTLVCMTVFLLPVLVTGADVLPPGRAYALEDLSRIIEILVLFLIYVSGFIMVGFIIWSGIKYMMAQGDPKKVDEAKAMFKSAIYGALIILGVGTILATIRIIVTGQFFSRGLFGF